MDLQTIIQFLLALLLVLVMMGGLALILRFVGGVRHMPLNKDKRLKIVESLTIDHKRRIVLLRRDNQEHLIALGPNSETVIETNILAQDIKIQDTDVKGDIKSEV